MSTPHVSNGIRAARLKIGLEVHVELATRTKMFTRAPNIAHPEFHDAAPNTLVDEVVAGFPGVLPVLNRRAVEMTIMVGLALNCQIARFSKWDRKNYFYPDLPKGYQISQYELPLCFDGELMIRVPSEMDRRSGALAHGSSSPARIGIIRAHLEEDTGKLGHELPGGLPYDGSLIDLNRAGTPLLEIVTEPDITGADAAVVVAHELRDICRFLGVTQGVMQRGHMRFEPNVNVIIDTDDGREFATPVVEIKNLNSFKALRGAIEHELERQVEQWRTDGLTHGPGMKTTRGWDDVRGITVLQRGKEDVHDYRYFPEPDIPPVVVDEGWLQDLKARLPELPAARRARYGRDFGLDADAAAALTAEPGLAAYFEDCVEQYHLLTGTGVPSAHSAKLCANWLLNAGARRAHAHGIAIFEVGISARQLGQLIVLRDRDQIGSTAADELFAVLCDARDDTLDAAEVARTHNLLHVRDDVRLHAWIEQAIAMQSQAAADFAAGKDAALGRIVGQVMKLSAGQAEVQAAREQIAAKLRR